MTAAGDADQLVDMINGAMETTIPLAHKNGLRVVEAGRGHAAVTVPAEGNGNHIGVIYAAQFTAARNPRRHHRIDNRRQSQVLPPSQKPSTSSSLAWRGRKSGRRPLLTRRRSRAVEAEAAQRGKADFTLEAVVTDADGQTFATSRGLYQLRAHGR
jgi:hypothetical protein